MQSAHAQHDQVITIGEVPRRLLIATIIIRELSSLMVLFSCLVRGATGALIIWDCQSTFSWLSSSEPMPRCRFMMGTASIRSTSH